MTVLRWPDERVRATATGTPSLTQPLSNICLDLHGDPRAGRLAVFSDGNHHMALREALQAFLAVYPEVNDVFYATTPPRIVVDVLVAGGISLGNLTIAMRPHVFISPPGVLDGLMAGGHVTAHRPLAESRGNVLLVRHGNPRGIRGIADLARGDVKVFLSNPVNEAVSYNVYAATLRDVARSLGLALDFLEDTAHPRVIYGECIHHREAPQAVVDGHADVAIVFHHLALRYTRIFPELFASVPLTPAGENDPGQVRSRVHISLVGDGGEWGARLAEFMLGDHVANIYRHHGLVPVR